LAKAVDTAHKADIALKDFVPDSKIDRLHARWEEGELVNFKLIDWNISGDRADIPDDLIFLDALVFALMTDFFPPLSVQNERYDFSPCDPAKLAGAAWAQLSPATRIFLERLVSPLSTVRPASAAATAHEIQWLVDLLRKQDEMLPADWVDDAYAQREMPIHVLMLAAAARQTLQPSVFLDDLLRLEGEAERALVAGEQRMAQNIEDELRYGVFRKAQRLLEENLPKITNEAVARQMRYRQQQTAFAIAQLDRGVSPLGTPEYQRLDSAVQAILNNAWQLAQDQLSIGVGDGPAVQALQAVVEWQLRHDTFETKILAERMFDVDGERGLEEDRLDRLNTVLQELAYLALRAAHLEPAMDAQVALLRQEIQDRHNFLDDLDMVQQYLDNSQEGVVLDIAQQRLRREPEDKRAAMLLCEAEENAAVRARVAKIASNLKDGRYALALEKLQALRKPDLLSEHAWGRISTRFDLSALGQRVRNENALLGEAEAAFKKLAQGLPKGFVDSETSALPLAPVEIAALRGWNTVIQEAQLWLEQRDDLLLPEDLRKRFLGLKDKAVHARADFWEARLRRFERALDAFTPEIEMDVHTLSRQLKAPDLALGCDADRYKELHNNRFAPLQASLRETQESLGKDDLDAAILAFRKLSLSPSLGEKQRAGVSRLLDWWEAVARDIERCQPLPEVPAGASWPGFDRLKGRMCNDLVKQLVVRAETAFSSNLWPRAAELYKLASNYGMLPGHHAIQYEKAQKLSKSIAYIERVLGDLRTSAVQSGEDGGPWFEEKRADLKKINDEITKLLDAWRQLPAEPSDTSDGLRRQLEEELDVRLWTFLPLAASQMEAENLEFSARRFGSIYRITGVQQWYKAGDLCSHAAKFLRSRPKWRDRELLLASSAAISANLKPLLQENVPPCLLTRARIWRENLSQAARGHIANLLSEVDAACEAAKPDLALDKLAKVTALSACSSDEVEEADFKARENRAHELKAMLQAIESVSKSLANGKDVFIAENDIAQWSKLPGYEQRVDLLRRIDSKKQALRRYASSGFTYAQRIADLQGVLLLGPEQGAPEPRGVDRPQVERDLAYRDAELNQDLRDALGELWNDLCQETQEAITTFGALLDRIEAGVVEPDSQEVARLASLLWQHAWCAEHLSVDRLPGQDGGHFINLDGLWPSVSREATQPCVSERDVAEESKYSDGSRPKRFIWAKVSTFFGAVRATLSNSTGLHKSETASSPEVEREAAAGVDFEEPSCGSERDVAEESKYSEEPRPKRFIWAKVSTFFGAVRTTLSNSTGLHKSETASSPEVEREAAADVDLEDPSLPLDGLSEADVDGSYERMMETMRSRCPESPGELQGLCSGLVSAVRQTRASVVMNCRSRAMHTQVSEKLERLQRLVEILGQQPQGVLPEGTSEAWYPQILHDTFGRLGRWNFDKWDSLAERLAEPGVWDEVYTALDKRSVTLKDIFDLLDFLPYLAHWQTMPQELAANIRMDLERRSFDLYMDIERREALLAFAFLSSPLYRVSEILGGAVRAVRNAEKAEGMARAAQEAGGADPRTKCEQMRNARAEVAQLPVSLDEDNEMQWLFDKDLRIWWNERRKRLYELSLAVLRSLVYEEARDIHNNLSGYKDPGQIKEKIDLIVASCKPPDDDRAGMDAFDEALTAALDGKPCPRPAVSIPLLKEVLHE